MQIENRKDFESFLPVSANRAYPPDALIEHGVEIADDPRNLIVEEKYDGSLYLAKFTQDGVRFTSRRLSAKDSKPVDKTGNLPHFALPSVVRRSMEGTLILGEVVLPGQQHSQINSVMNSKPEKAIAYQREHGNALYIAFDIVWANGTDLRGLSFLHRTAFLQQLVGSWRNCTTAGREYLCLSQQHPGKSAVGLYQKIIKRGGEGVMIKDLHAPYGKGIYKVKKSLDVSVFVSGYVEGEGKYAGQIGALKFSITHNLKTYELGQCSGMTDAVRFDISKNRKGYLHKVMDVIVQPPDDIEKFVPGEDRLRHPRFGRFRDDLLYTQCTFQKFKDDFLRFQG